jgi:hypothetical protein
MNNRTLAALLLSLSTLAFACGEREPTEPRGATSAKVEGNDDGEGNWGNWGNEGSENEGNDYGKQNDDRGGERDYGDQNDVWRCWEKTGSERCYELA